MTSYETLKETGSNHWKNNNFEEAIISWSEAVDACNKEDPSNKNFLKLVYSNRSAAYLKLKQSSAALVDAEKCVTLDSSWSKGYTRKGDALYALGKYTDCFNAYNSALRYATGDEKKSLDEKAVKAMNAIRNHDAERSSNNSNSNSSRNSSSTGLIHEIEKYIRIALFVTLFGYILPFGRQLNFTSVKLYAASAVILKMISIYSKYGMIKFNMDYAGRVLSDPVSMQLFLAVLLLTSKPYFLSMLPLAMFELTYYTQDIAAVARKNLPLVQSQVIPLLARFAPSVMQGNDPGRMLTESFSPTSINRINNQLLFGAAYCEIVQGLYLIVELVLPSRNFMTTMLWWQYLQMRYMVDKSGEIKSAFYSIDQQISGILSNRNCPPILLSLYGQLKTILANRVEQPSGRSAIPKCSIM